MAEIEISGECSSHIMAKSKDNNEVTICKKCSVYETQLKEALDELISIRMINELLQKELFTCATPKSTWGIEPDTNGNDVQPFESKSSKMSYAEVAAAGGKWIAVVHSFTKKKTPAVSAVATEQSYMSSNRFTPLTNLNENQTVEINPRTNCEWPSATNFTKKNTIQPSDGNKIPTIINGKITKVETKKQSSSLRTHHVFLVTR